MKKGILALGLAFTTLFCATACQKLEDSDEYKVETKAYAVDDKGETQAILTRTNEEGSTEMYYVDDKGEEKTVKEKETVVEKKVVSKTTKGPTTTKTAAEEMVEVMGALGGVTNPQKAFHTRVTQPKLQMERGTIKQNEIKTVVVTTNKQGEPVSNAVQNFYNAVSTEKKSTIKMVVSTESDGTTLNVPLTYSVYGDEKCIEMDLPISEDGKTTLTCRGLVLKRDGKQKVYLAVPDLKVYLEMPEDMEDSFYLELINQEENKGTYVSSGEYTAPDGKVYKVETYQTDTSTAKYFFDGEELKRLEISDGSSSTIIEYQSRENWANQNLFSVSGYKDLSTMINDEGELISYNNAQNNG
ncbi:MAG: hypothetical protein K6B52_03620 [Clostridiales bacterium]|nr:hypothetical protein [Clostridiales bacterium]